MQRPTHAIKLAALASIMERMSSIPCLRKGKARHMIESRKRKSRQSKRKRHTWLQKKLLKVVAILQLGQMMKKIQKRWMKKSQM